jgi:hypothetical protein
MSQEFRPHPVLSNYEASRDGIVRHRIRKKPVGFVGNTGYLKFSAGKKKYYCHRFTYECFNGLLKEGLVIDHIDGCPQNNLLSNLQAVTQSENLKKGRTGTCKSVGKRAIQSFDTETNEQKTFQLINAAAKYFDICPPSVRFVAEGIRITATSKLNKHKIQFQYITPSGNYSCVDRIFQE